MFEDPNSLHEIARQALKRAQTSVKWFAEVRDTVDGKPVIAIANPEGEAFQVETTSARDRLIAKLCGPSLADRIRQDRENV